MPKPNKLEYYSDLVRDMYDNPTNLEKRKVWEAIDKMARCEVVIPKAIKDWIGGSEEDMKFASPMVADSVSAIQRFLAPKMPDINLVALSPEIIEKQGLENIEQVLEWEFGLLNKRGTEPFFSKLVDAAARYSAVAFQTKFFPYEAKRKSGEVPLYSKEKLKQLKRMGNFSMVMHPRSCVYETFSDDCLEEVAAVSIRSVYDLVKEYGMDNKTIRKMFTDLTLDEKTPSDLRDTYVTYVDFCNYYCRVVWAVPCNSNRVSFDGEKYEFQREEHKLGFIPWVVVDFNKPMFENIYRAGIYDRIAQVRAVARAKMMAYGAETNDVYNTAVPQNPNIIQSQELGQPEVLDNQTTHSRLNPTPPDPNLMTLEQMLFQEMAQSAAVTPLLDVGNIGGNTPFMSINAKQTTAVAQLGIVQQVVERAVEAGLYQMLQWLDYSEEALLGYRTKQKNDYAMGQAGMPMMIQSSKMMPQEGPIPPNVTYFDIEKVHVKVKLKPQLIQDKQAEAALAQLRQAVGWSRMATLEDGGVENPERMVQEKYIEVLDDAAIQLEAQKQAMIEQAKIEIEKMKAQAKIQMEATMAQIQAQSQSQAQPAPTERRSPETQANEANSGQFAPTQGTDSRFGGPAPANTVPGTNRNQITNRDQAGQPA